MDGEFAAIRDLQVKLETKLLLQKLKAEEANNAGENSAAA
jgi:hypothetical protein